MIIKWDGDHILYQRRDGYGLLVGKLHYRFDKEGRLEAVDPVTEVIIQLVHKMVNVDERVRGLAVVAGTRREESDHV